METSVMNSTSSPSKHGKTTENKSFLSSSTLDKSDQKCLQHSSISTNCNESNLTKKSKEEELCLQKGVYGIVKWYNVKFRYGFIKRFDTQEDNGIKRSSPNKAKSIGDGEVVQFDIYKASKGPEARNVTGPEGKPARASRFARIINRFIIPKYINNYSRPNPNSYRRYNTKIKQNKNLKEKKIQNIEKSPLKVSTAENKSIKQNDEIISKTTKESGYSSNQEKTTSTSVKEILSKQNQKKRKTSKKIIYIIKDERNSADLNESDIQNAIQKSVSNCTCTHI